MKWLVALTLLAAAGTSQAEQEVSIANALSRPVGVVYLLDIISPPRQKTEAFNYKSSNFINDDPSYGNKHSYLLVQQTEDDRETPSKYLVRQRREAYPVESHAYGNLQGSGLG